MIFSRGRGSGGRHHWGDESRRSGRSAPSGSTGRDPDADNDAESAAELEAAQVAAKGYGQQGPYDITEAPTGVDRLDLGSLQIPAIDGVEVRVQANPDGVISQVVLVLGDNALQLGVFAAPRSAGIWAEVREEIRKSLYADGVAAEELDGDYGVELRSRVRTPEGMADIRFVGVDGPRWMVRAVFQGPAALDVAVAEPLLICLRGLVVDRGREAMPVREALPLRLPRDAAEQAHTETHADNAVESRTELPGVGPLSLSGSGQSAPPAPPAGTNGQQVLPPADGAPGARRKPSPRPRRSK